jgi:ATP-dependent Clp protease, protease subunit
VKTRLDHAAHGWGSAHRWGSPPEGPGRPGPEPHHPGWPPIEPGLAPWLEERLFDQRIVLLQGPLTGAAATRAGATLLTLDALNSEPVRLHLATPDGDLAAVFALVDVLDTLRAPVHAVVTAEVGGGAVGVLVAAGSRSAYPHARIRLAEPRADGLAGTADEVAAAAGRYLRELEELVLRIAEVTGQPRSRVEDDLSAGRLLTASDAKSYGLVDEIVGGPRE